MFFIREKDVCPEHTAPLNSVCKGNEPQSEMLQHLNLVVQNAQEKK